MLRQLSLPLWRARWGRTLLTLLSVTIGVAGFVAVRLAIITTRQSYANMEKMLSGRADLEVVGVTGQTIDQGLAEQLAKAPEVAEAQPVIQRPTIMYLGKARAKLMVVGLDSDPKTIEADYRLQRGQWFDNQQGALVDATFASSKKIELGDDLKLFVGQRGMKHVKVVGWVMPRGVSSTINGGTVLLPLAQAQEVFGVKRRVDAIQVVLKPGTTAAAAQAQLASLLPAGIVLRTPASRSNLGAATTEKSEQGMDLAGMLLLVLGVFTILNTFLMGVTERRKQFAILRAIGATRRQVLMLVVNESLVLGLIGSTLGVAAGILGAYGLNRGLEQLMLIELPPFVMSYPWVIASFVLGLLISVGAAVWPAIRASWISPNEGMGASSIVNETWWRHVLAAVGVVAGLIGAAILSASMLGHITLMAAVPGGTVMLIGFVLCIPELLRPLVRLVDWLPAQVDRAETLLARIQILQHPVRAALTAGMLFLALACSVTLGTTILGQVTDVNNWLTRTLTADFVIRAMMPDMSTGLSEDIPIDVLHAVEQVPDVAHISSLRLISVRVDGQSALAIAKDVSPDDRLPIDLKIGEEKDVEQRLIAGEVVLGSPLAQKLNKTVGDQVTLDTPQGQKPFRVAGVCTEYLAGGVALYMDRHVAERLLEATGVSAVLIKSKEASIGQVEERVRQIADDHGMLFQSAATLRSEINTMVTGLVGGLWGLLTMGLVVAAFGIVNTLMMNVLEQTRELALMRVVAMTRAQLRRTILIQAHILGLIGLVPGVLVGLGLGWLMHVGTARQFGQLMDYSPQPMLVGGLFCMAVVIVVLAAFIPAQRAARLELLTALHHE